MAHERRVIVDQEDRYGSRHWAFFVFFRWML
jgi:hypothetical protein